MNTKQIFTIIIMAAVLISARAQDHDALMKVVLENNRELRVAREACHLAILEAGTGNMPPDPEVEFGYLFGKPAELGNRVDFRVSQQVDFPTAYIHRSRLRSIRSSQAELEYILARQDILHRAEQVWIQRTYLNMQEAMIKERLESAVQIKGHFRQKLASGEVSQLAYSQANLQVVALESSLEKLKSDISINDLELLEITGGATVALADSIYPDPARIIPDSLLQAYREGATMQIHAQQLELKEEQKSLSVSQNLPKLRAGYFSESVLDQAFRGFQVGITVPLWENSKRIKQAKSAVVFAEADADRYTHQQQREVLQKLEQLESLNVRIQKLEEALDFGRGDEMLTLSLKNGEISLTDYFYASDFYFRNALLLLDYKRDHLLMEADLMKVYL